jgi:protein-tyrosine phosphatase
MIDIHTHILPGVDDGATNMAEALQIARIAVEDGTSHMFATPHHNHFKPIYRQQLVERVASLQAELDNANIPLTIIPGYELRLHQGLFEDWDNQFAGPLGDSRYVLSEPPFYNYDSQISDVLYELFERGYIPILAHPERIIPIQRNISLIEPFLARGGLTQITAESLTSRPAYTGRVVAEQMLRQGMVHIIASDAHNTDNRPPIMTKARDMAAKIVGFEQANAMVTTTPMAVVDSHNKNNCSPPRSA